LAGSGLTVGAAGEGSLTISQGGFASATAATIGATGATGAVTVTDPNSVLTTFGPIDVGLGGDGSEF
jgi:T5SS/PEP-CTERM-associated repeat protein